jgi:hypothetical protein
MRVDWAQVRPPLGHKLDKFVSLVRYGVKKCCPTPNIASFNFSATLEQERGDFDSTLSSGPNQAR